MPKISQYTPTTTLTDDDLFDVSVLNLDGTYSTKSITKADLETAIGGGGGGTDIYSADGTLGADRTVDMDGNELTFDNIVKGIGVGGVANEFISLDGSMLNEHGWALPNGATGSRPVPADATTGHIWFNTTTNQFEGWNGTNWVLLG